LRNAGCPNHPWCLRMSGRTVEYLDQWDTGSKDRKIGSVSWRLSMITTKIPTQVKAACVGHPAEKS
jgi:hypothetical protein